MSAAEAYAREERRRRDKEKEQRWRSLDLGGKGLKNLSPSLYHYTFLVRLQINHNDLRYLSPAIGSLSNLSVLDASGNGLLEIPPELGNLTELTELLLFDNQLRDLPLELGKLWQLRFIGLEGNPLEEPFPSLLAIEGTRGLIHYCRDNRAITSEPAPRRWRDHEPEHLDGEPFTVMTFNILSDKYATPTMYAYTPSWALEWPYRRDRILREILQSEADIICLQEVEAGEYEDFFRGELAATHDGHFWYKSRAKTMEDAERRRVDGCATFFRHSAFSLLAQQVVGFSELAMQRSDIPKNEDVFTRFMSKDNVSGIALLAHKASGHRLIVANAHIHWDPEFPDVKLIQVGMLTEMVERLGEGWAHEFPLLPNSTAPPYDSTNLIPSLLCGDLNSLTDSGVHELLSRGGVHVDHPDLTRGEYGKFVEGGLHHTLHLRSAYAETEGEEGAWTNWSPHFRGVLDYIWYSAPSLTLTASLGLIHDPAYTSQIVGLPSAALPSDHIPLLARMGFRTPASARGDGPSPSSSRRPSSPSQGSGQRFVVGGGGRPGERKFSYRK